MELVRGTPKFESEEEDVISRMPEKVITKILDCLPTQDAVRTDILSRNWRLKWTLLTQLVFDSNFFKYLQGQETTIDYNGRHLSRLLLHLTGPIIKFVLHVRNYKVLDIEDIRHWFLFVSRKGIKELTLLNSTGEQLTLPTHIFSCVELKHLKLCNCCIRVPHSFRGFPYLLSLDIQGVEFDTYTCGEFIARCPSVEILVIGSFVPSLRAKLDEIEILKHLKILYLPLCILDNMPMLTSSSIFEFVGHLPKLEELNLNFHMPALSLKEAGTKKLVRTDFLCLKTLTLYDIDFRSDIMVSFILELIYRSPNMKTLEIIAACENGYVPPTAVYSSDLDFNTTRQSRLMSVAFECLRGLENEVCLIKYLLACSPLLKTIDVMFHPYWIVGGADGKFMIATKLLKLHRASPDAEINIY